VTTIEDRRLTLMPADRMREALAVLGVAYNDLRSDRWQSVRCPLCDDTAKAWEKTLSVCIEWDRCKCFRCGFGFDDSKASSAGLLEAASMGWTVSEAVTEAPKRKRGRPSKIDKAIALGQGLDFSWLDATIPKGGTYRRTESALSRLWYMIEAAARSYYPLSWELGRQYMTADDVLGIVVEWVTVRPEHCRDAFVRPHYWVAAVNRYLWSKDVVSAVCISSAGIEQVETIPVGGAAEVLDLDDPRVHGDTRPNHDLCVLGLDDDCPFRVLDPDGWEWAHAMIRTIGDRF
jgi:hypothetical protein